MKTLRDVLPQEFFRSFMDTRAAKFLHLSVVSEHESYIESWPGVHRNVHSWWTLENGKRVGWNENPGKGWSFPVI